MEGTKIYLSQLKHLDKEIQTKVDTLTQTKELLTTISATQHNTTKVKGGRQTDLSDVVVQVENLERLNGEINFTVDRLVNLRRTIIDEINELSERLYRIILERYFVQGHTLESIAEYVGYSRRQLFEHYNRALTEFYLLHESTIKQYLKTAPECTVLTEK